MSSQAGSRRACEGKSHHGVFPHPVFRALSCWPNDDIYSKCDDASCGGLHYCRTLRVKTTVKKLRGILNRYEGNPKVLLLFVAGDDKETKESWCPDCRIATPVIYSMIEGKGYTVIEVDVGDRPT